MLRVELDEIARIEKVSRQGTKEELMKRLGKKVRLKKIWFKEPETTAKDISDRPSSSCHWRRKRGCDRDNEK